jgi:hypothetical protein
MIVQDSNLFKHPTNNLNHRALSSVVEHFLGMEGAAGATEFFAKELGEKGDIKCYAF